MADIALVRGSERSQNITATLNLIKKEISGQIKRLKKNEYILIKPNLLTTKRPLAVTHIQAMEALLDFLRQFYSGRIVIAEGTSIGSTQEAFRNYGYYQLEEKYKVELLDINRDEGIAAEAYDRNLKPMKVLFSRTIAEAPYRISVSPLKTHNSVIVSLGIENMVTGSLLKGGMRPVNTAYRVLFRRHFHDYKSAISQSYTSHNLSIARLAQPVMPHLTILDGFTAMERNGPVGGQPIDMHIALAGTDAIAVDSLGTYLMGMDPGRVGYLHYLNFSEHEIRVVGNKISECRQRIRPHDSYQDQLKWYNAKSVKEGI